MIDIQFTAMPVCPHCGHVDKDAWELNFEGGCEGETTSSCGKCGRDYSVSKRISVFYSTEKIEPDNRPAFDTSTTEMECVDDCPVGD